MTGTTNPKPRTIADLCAAAADACHCDPALILTRDRTAPVALARHFLYVYLRRELGFPLADTGRIMGMRDHSTISYGIERMDGYMTTKHRAIGNQWARFAHLTDGWATGGWSFPALHVATTKAKTPKPGIPHTNPTDKRGYFQA